MNGRSVGVIASVVGVPFANFGKRDKRFRFDVDCHFEHLRVFRISDAQILASVCRMSVATQWLQERAQSGRGLFPRISQVITASIAPFYNQTKPF